MPLRRPSWWFDPAVARRPWRTSAHLADLAFGLFGWVRSTTEGRRVLTATRWPKRVELDDFRQITGLSDVPPELDHLRDRKALTYWGNGMATARIRGHVVRLTTRWGVRADGPDGDTHFAVARGSRSTITVRHESAMGPWPQVFVAPVPTERLEVRLASGRHHRPMGRGDVRT